MRKPTTLLLVLAAGLSCSKDSGTGPTPPPSITILPDSSTVNLFDHLQLRAVVVNAKGDTLNDAVTWTSESPNVVFISTSGVAQGLTRGTATILADADGAEASARVKVRITVIQVQLHPNGGTLQVGDTERIKDTLITANGQLPDDSIVTWTSSDTTKAVVSSSGLVTARAQGSVTISAQVDSAVSHAVFTIPEPVTKVTLSAHLDTLRQDSIFHVTATPIGTANDTLLTYPVTWTSSDTSVARLSPNSFDANIGAYQAGRAVIRAQIGSVFDSLVVIVVRPSVATIAVSVLPASGTRILPGGFNAHATIKDSTGVVLGNRLISWTLSDTSVADIGPSTGTDVTVTGKKGGLERVYATSETKVDSALLTFVHPSVAAEHIVPDTGSFVIPTQSFFGLNAIVLDSLSDTLTDRVTTWSINDSTIATLSPMTGPGSNVIGKKGGLAVVVATTEGHVDTARIRVIRPSVSKIVLSPDTVTIVVPNGVTISSTIEDSLGQQLFGRPTHWAVVDTAIGTISDTNGDYINVGGKASGTARIVASAEGVTDTAYVHVIVPSVAQVVWSPPVDTSHLLVHSVRSITAEALDSNGTPLSRPVTFGSSDSALTAFAFTSQSGPYAFTQIKGLGVGSATISASSAGKSVTWHASIYSVGYDTVAAGSNESCMPATDGLIYCWGKNGNFPFPTPVVTPAGIHGLTAKLGLACGLDAGGSAYCWGSSSGPDGTSGFQGYDTARAVTGGTLFSQVDVGWDHLCGVTSTGGLSCWGNNGKAQLGLGDSTARTQPTALTVGSTFVSVSSGYYHTCAVATGGQAYCWGANGSGQSGQPLGGDIPPMPVSGAVTFSVVSAGYDHSCGVSTTGAAYCWGSNSQGQLGTGDTVSHSTPTLVSGGLTFKTIAAGLLSTCAVTTGGAAYCWGYDGNYTLGTATQGNSTVPVAVSGGLTFTSIGAGLGGNGNVCGMTTSGAYCWGSGAAGGGSLVPVKIPGQP